MARGDYFEFVIAVSVKCGELRLEVRQRSLIERFDLSLMIHNKFASSELRGKHDD